MRFTTLTRGTVGRRSLLFSGVIYFSLFCLAACFGVRTGRARASGAEPVPLRPELVLQTGHSESVTRVVFAPDERWVATASSDSTARIWETATGRELRCLTGHAGGIRAMAVTPDGASLITGGNDRTIRLWNVDTGGGKVLFTGTGGSVLSIALSADGRSIAAGFSDGRIKLIETVTGREGKEFAGLPGAVWALAFSPDGGSLAAASADNAVRIWDLARDKGPRVLTGHTDRINDLAFSPDGQLLASGGADLSVRIWSVSNGRAASTYTGHKAKILSVYFRDNAEIFSADSSGVVRSWDPKNGQETATVDRSRQSPAMVSAGSAAFGRRGDLAAFGNGNRSASVVDIRTGDHLESLESRTTGFNGVAFSPDSHWLAVAGLDNTVKIWDLQSGESLSPLAGHDAFVRCVVFHPDSRRVISASLDGTIKVWDLVLGKLTATLTGHTGAVNSIAVSADGKRLVSGSFDGSVRVWDLIAMKELATLPGKVEVKSVAFSPDARLILIGSTDRSLRLWNGSQASEPQVVAAGPNGIEAVAFSPDGESLASGTTDGSVQVRNPAGQQTAAFQTVAGLASLSFAPDGRSIATVGGRTVSVSGAAGEKKWSSEASAGGVRGVSFSPDGKWLASASEDGSVDLWNAETGVRAVSLLSLREDGDWLVVSPAGLFDGSPQAWKQLIWRFSGSTFNVSPVEAFFNEFYRPGLLADVLSGRQADNSVDITKRDRRQPRVEISMPSQQIAGKIAKIRLRVAEAPGGNGLPGAGAKDVRLFRNGSLVRFWPDNVLPAGKSETYLDADVPIVGGENVFTAYAFNRDDVKSDDRSLRIEGPAQLKRPGTTYIVVIGVGKYSNPDFDLNFIESDVRTFGDTLRSKQAEAAPEQKVVMASLTNEQATKANILAMLNRLASGPASADGLQAAQPEDTVVVYFSGHGLSEKNRFYMIPYDLGYTGPRADLGPAELEKIGSHSISDLELEQAFRGIDAKNLLLIIDACNSGQALETDEKRQGPMNSKGLAQLAYDKGMYVLTAAQSEEVAYVSHERQRSYLTFALVDEGLLSSAADNSPTDGKVLLREWFDYATRRVPQMRRDELDKMGLTVAQNDKAKKLTAVVTALGMQRPRTFYRRETDRQSMVIARVPTAAQKEQ